MKILRKQVLQNNLPTSAQDPRLAFIVTSPVRFSCFSIILHTTPLELVPAVSNDQLTYIGQSFSFMSLQEPNDSTWFMETYATSHLASNSRILNSFSNKSYINYVLVHIRLFLLLTLAVPSFFLNVVLFTLQSVLVTSDIIKNLVFIRKITNDKKVSIEFDDFGFSVKDFLTK